MQIHRSLIEDFLRSQGEGDKVVQLNAELPTVVDSDRDRELLEKFGLSPMDMVAKLAGGGGLGNIPGS
jgi:hypothetical protein